MSEVLPKLLFVWGSRELNEAIEEGYEQFIPDERGLLQLERFNKGEIPAMVVWGKHGYGWRVDRRVELKFSESFPTTGAYRVQAIGRLVFSQQVEEMELWPKGL